MELEQKQPGHPKLGPLFYSRDNDYFTKVRLHFFFVFFLSLSLSLAVYIWLQAVHLK